MWRGIVVGVAFALGMVASNAMAENEETLISRVLDRRICYESFWRYDRTFRFGATIAVSYLFANGRGYAWSDDFARDKMDPVANSKLFAIATQGRQSLAAEYFDTFTMNNPGIFRYVKKMMHEIPQDPKIIFYQVPTDCTPQFDPSTPWKVQAIEKIARVMERESRKLAKPGDPAKVEIVIGDFNFDYPAAVIYIPQLKMLFDARFRDDDHPLKDLASLDRMSIAQELKATDQFIKERGDKALKYGIKRTIHWGAKP